MFANVKVPVFFTFLMSVESKKMNVIQPKNITFEFEKTMKIAVRNVAKKTIDVFVTGHIVFL